MSNRLLAGDNLEIMRSMPSESIDLIYCDPPYNTGRDFGDFNDRWASDDAYYDFCRARIIEIHRLLKPTGSLYWHCDPNTSHYIKVMLDGIFGKRNFRNEIVWCYTGASRATKQFPNKHDTLFWYSRTSTWTFSIADITIPYVGIRNGQKNGAPNNLKRVAELLARGKIPESWWIFPAGGQIGNQLVGYPTQKPLPLLERIISASSNEGDLILDPFCGSGTTLVAAKRLRRDYIGIDSSQRAIDVATKRLQAQLAPML